jgi:hypothetical protein
VTLVKIKMKHFRFALLLTGCSMLGCVATQQHDWPWNTKNDYDMQQTGSFISASVGVAQFDGAPAAVKPVAPETAYVPHAENAAKSPTASAQSIVKNDSLFLPSAAMPVLVKKGTNASEYDFSLTVVKIAQPSYLPTDSVSTKTPVTAFNHGLAPVSLVFSIDESSQQKWASDKTLPVFAVIPPNSEQVVAHLSEKIKHESGSIKSSYLWFLGDYNGSHLPSEHYQFPFPKNVKASASIPTDRQTSVAFKHSVRFSLPLNTPILAARKGTVVRIKGGNKVDVLHDDSTIASYEHLGGIDQGISLGSVVSTEDRIGIVGALGKEKVGYLQLKVWQPTIHLPAGPKADPSGTGFDVVSLPMEFCSPNFKGCRVLTDNEQVSRGPLGRRQSKTLN